jgi:hypothetical protein
LIPVTKMLNALRALARQSRDAWWSTLSMGYPFSASLYHESNAQTPHHLRSGYDVRLAWQSLLDMSSSRRRGMTSCLLVIWNDKELKNPNDTQLRSMVLDENCFHSDVYDENARSCRLDPWIHGKFDPGASIMNEARAITGHRLLVWDGAKSGIYQTWGAVQFLDRIHVCGQWDIISIKAVSSLSRVSISAAMSPSRTSQVRWSAIGAGSLTQPRQGIQLQRNG